MTRNNDRPRAFFFSNSWGRAALALVGAGLFAATSQAATYTANYLGNGIWEQDGGWSTTAYPNNGHFVVINGSAVPDDSPLYQVSLTNPAPCALGISVAIQSLNVTSGATLNIQNSSSITSYGAVVLGGTVTLNSSNDRSQLRAGASSGVSATGVISMSDSGTNYISGAGDGYTFTVNAGGIIRGAGQLNLGYFGGNEHLLNFVNQGLIEATQPNNLLQIGLGARVGSALSNNGTLRASGSGSLRIHGFNEPATVTNAGGTISATDNARVRVASTVTVVGGTLTTAGNGTIGGDPTGGLFKDIVSTGTMGIADGESIQLGGTFTNNGLIRLTSTGSGATLRMANDTTLNGTGTVSLSDNGSNYIEGVNTGDAFTIAPSMTIQGSGTFSPGPSGGTNVAKVTNQGLIVANLTAGLAMRVEDFANTPLTNTGTMRAANGSTFTIYSTNGGKAFNAGGTMEALDLSTFRIANNVTLEGGTITTSGSGAFRGPGTFSNVTNSGTIALGTNEILFLAGILTNNGTVKMEEALAGSDVTLRLSSDVTIAGTGTILLSSDMAFHKIDADALGRTLTIGPGQKIMGGGVALGGYTINFVNGGLIESSAPTQGIAVLISDANNHSNFTNASTGLVRAANGRTLSFNASGLASVTNSGGRLEAVNNGLIQFTGNASYTQTAGTFDLQDGKVETQLGLDINGGSLIGIGTITGPVRNNGGIVGPGHSPGTITINGDYTQAANGTLSLEIGGTTPGTGYDQLIVSGKATLGGTLNITAINGFKPIVGDIFTLVSAGSFAGSFSTVTSNGFTGKIDSSSNGITLTVTTTAGQLLNVATRMRVQPDPNELIGGFIITGADPKRVVIRATGPSLSSFFSGVLADPTLEIFQGDTKLASNDNWKDTDQAAIEATGVAPKNDMESAIVRTFSPGAYTAIVRGKNGTSGIGLVEAYDLSTTSNSSLANIATRGFVDTDDNVMIGGFIIGKSSGSQTKVVIRGIGPSLTPFGVEGALADPTLELRDANGSLLKGNDNWKDSQEAEIEAAQLAPRDERESAIFASLADGNYTAIVRGKSNTKGVGLVEVYLVP